MAVRSERGLSLPEMTAMAAASDSVAPRLAARSSAIFRNRSAAAIGTELRDLAAWKKPDITITTQQHSISGLFSRTTQVSLYQKDKPFGIFAEAEMMGWH